MPREKGRGYSWPPFEPGHQITRTHGARSSDVPEVAAPRADAIAESAPWLNVPAFRGAAMDVAMAEVVVERLLAAVLEADVLDDTGRVRGVIAQLDRYLGRLSKLRAEAGLTPLSMAAMLERLSAVEGSVAQDAVEALKQAGRAIRAEAEGRRLSAAQGPESGGAGLPPAAEGEAL